MKKPLESEQIMNLRAGGGPLWRRAADGPGSRRDEGIVYGSLSACAAAATGTWFITKPIGNTEAFSIEPV